MVVWFNEAAKGSQSAKEFMKYNAELESMNDRSWVHNPPAEKAKDE